MRKSYLLVDQLSFPHLSISERDMIDLIPFIGGQITVRKSHIIVQLMVLQLLMALVIMALMMAA